MTPVHTKRLVLRAFAQDDIPAILTAMTDPDVARWIPLLPFPYTPADADSFVALQTSDKRNALAVTHMGVLVGCITTVKELGYWFAKPAWGQGFATEAARTVVADHFAQNTEALESGYMLDNARSARVLKKLGFVPTHQLTRPATLIGQDVIIQRVELPHAAWKGASC